MQKLILKNQCKTDKQNLEKKMKLLIKKARCKQFNDYNRFEYKISEVENKIPDTCSLVSTTVLNRKVREVENRIKDHAKYISTQEFNKLTFCCKIKTI